jgi:hypothetical protein
MSERFGFERVALVNMPRVDRGVCERRSHHRGERQGGDEGLHGNLLRGRCQTIRRDSHKIRGQPAGTIKLAFRKTKFDFMIGGKAAVISVADAAAVAPPQGYLRWLPTCCASVMGQAAKSNFR